MESTIFQGSSQGSSSSGNTSSTNNHIETKPGSLIEVLEYGLIEVIFLSFMFAMFISCRKMFAKRDRRTDTGNDILYDPILSPGEVEEEEEEKSADTHINNRNNSSIELISQS